MAKKAYKRNPKTEAARAELIALSAQAKAQVALLKATTGADIGVNEVLLVMYQEQTGCKDFRRFDQWKEAGYKVKKGESSFRVWGSPVKAKKTAGGEDFVESVDAGTEGETAAKYEYWPMCSLFNESQVEPMGRDTGTSDENLEAGAEASPQAGEFVKVAEYRQRIEHLERTFNYDRQSCVGDQELANWRKIAKRVLATLEGTDCKRAKPEDRERRAAIIARVRAYLDSNPTPPPSGSRRRATPSATESTAQQGAAASPAATDPINQHREDLGNNESASRGLFPQPDGTFLAMTFISSKTFKTVKGAENWLYRRGLLPNGASKWDPQAVASFGTEKPSGLDSKGNQDLASTEAKNDEVKASSPFVSSRYSDNLEARREAREDRARAASQRGDQLATTARKMADVIPFGQPILVGHHSERRDRAYRGRIGAKMDKAVDEFKKARYYQEKAASVGKGGIASDDPEALEKLAVKLEKAERLQAVMKAANKAIRAGDDQALAALDFSPKQIEELKRPDFAGRVGFAGYQLTNNNAEIRRLKGRIEGLKALRAGPAIEHDHEDFAVTVQEGRVVLDFKHGKPSAEARQIVKDGAFNFSKSRGGVWVRKATENALAAAESVIKKLESLPSIY